MASWHIQQLKFVFGVGGFMSFYGGLSLAIYFLGEYGGIKIQYRFAMIAVLLLTLPIALVIALVSSRRKKNARSFPERILTNRFFHEFPGENRENQNECESERNLQGRIRLRTPVSLPVFQEYQDRPMPEIERVGDQPNKHDRLPGKNSRDRGSPCRVGGNEGGSASHRQ